MIILKREPCDWLIDVMQKRRVPRRITPPPFLADVTEEPVEYATYDFHVFPSSEEPCEIIEETTEEPCPTVQPEECQDSRRSQRSLKDLFLKTFGLGNKEVTSTKEPNLEINSEIKETLQNVKDKKTNGRKGKIKKVRCLEGVKEDADESLAGKISNFNRVPYPLPDQNPHVIPIYQRYELDEDFKTSTKSPSSLTAKKQWPRTRRAKTDKYSLLEIARKWWIEQKDQESDVTKKRDGDDQQFSQKKSRSVEKQYRIEMLSRKRKKNEVSPRQHQKGRKIVDERDSCEYHVAEPIVQMLEKPNLIHHHHDHHEHQDHHDHHDHDHLEERYVLDARIKVGEGLANLLSEMLNPGEKHIRILEDDDEEESLQRKMTWDVIETKN